MATSRTTPIKLATAPIPGSFDRALTSSPGSKSSRWTETFMSASGDRREKRYLVARLDARRGLGHVLVHGDSHELALGQRALPCFPPIYQVGAQTRHRGDARRKLDFLCRSSQR